MKLQKRVKRTIACAAPLVDARLTIPEADAVLGRLEAIFVELAPDVPSFQSRFNQMVLTIALDALAFYRALQQVMPKEEALTFIQPFVNNWMDGQFDSWVARKVYANRTLHRLYRRYWFAEANRADDPDGQKFEYLPPKGELFYGVNVLRCGICKYLNRMQAPELAPYICRGDEHIGKYLPPGITFERSQVIAEGGEMCDFRYLES